jgi:hypothetical protein
VTVYVTVVVPVVGLLAVTEKRIPEVDPVPGLSATVSFAVVGSYKTPGPYSTVTAGEMRPDRSKTS